MSNYDDSKRNGEWADYEIDPREITRQFQSNNSKLAKVKYHALPAGDSLSKWRILPLPKVRTFYKAVRKHWSIPGVRGSVTCPRSFIDPNTNAPYRCYLCEKTFAMVKSSDSAENTIGKQLQARTGFYMNALDIDHLDLGVGVLQLQYSAHRGIVDLLNIPEYQNFTHPLLGRTIIIKAREVPGSVVPNSQNKAKREFTILPASKAEPVPYQNWKEELVDLETFLGIPTYEMTQAYMQRTISGDETLGRNLYDAGKAFVQRSLAEGKETAATPIVKKQEPSGPAYSLVPIAEMPPTGHKACFGYAFNESNEICLKCPEIDACELETIKRARAQKKSIANRDIAADIANVLTGGTDEPVGDDDDVPF